MEAGQNKREAKPLATLLTKADAMIHAAEALERQAVDLELIAMVAEIFNKPHEKPLGDQALAHLNELRVMSSGIVDKGLQVAAMRAAASEIRALANETKLADARASRDGIRAATPA